MHTLFFLEPFLDILLVFTEKIKMQNNEVEAFSASLFNTLLMQFRPQLCINNHRKVGFLFSISTEVQDNYLHFMRVLTAFDWYVICKIHDKHRCQFN